MFRSLVSDARRLIKGNIRTLALREVLLTLTAGLTGGLDALYVKEILGADAVALGLLASIWSTTFLSSVLLGGWLSDHYDRKSVLLIGMILTLPNPLIFAFAADWRITIVANVLGALGTAFVTPAYIALLYSFSEQANRSRIIATMNTMTSLVNVVVPPLGALTIQRLGGLNQIRTIFIIQFLISLCVVVLTAKRMESSVRQGSAPSLGPIESVRKVFGQMRAVYRASKERGAAPWLIIALTGPWAWETVAPFWVIYASEVCGSSLTILGLLPAVYSLTLSLLLYPFANVSDREGRKKVILIARPFLYLSVITLLIGGIYRHLEFVSMIPLLAWVFRAIGDSSGPAWTAAAAEPMPEELQSEWQAVREFLWRAMTIPASIIGGLMWNIDPKLPFLFALLIDGLIRFPILIHFIPETLVVKRTVQPPGPHIIIYGLPEAGKTVVAQLIKKELNYEMVDQPSIKPLFKFVFFGDKVDRAVEKQVTETLSKKKAASVIEGEAAIFAAKERDKGIVVLLVASKDERIRRKAQKKRMPEFIALKEIEKEDHEISKAAKKLFGADISRLPPFDIAINTERIPPEKIVKIISILQGGESEQH
ncbi:MAG: MFS transporter [Candidatus Bathyarchaeota archaeon]|nr:MFS transporter [Candidatus Bathyarchaeota archaeon]